MIALFLSKKKLQRLEKLTVFFSKHFYPNFVIAYNIFHRY